MTYFSGTPVILYNVQYVRSMGTEEYEYVLHIWRVNQLHVSKGDQVCKLEAGT